ncbi:MAG: hypothetical protein ACI9N1_000347 [Flavobacteriales bacterium]|jgi:hypothetical protein
MDRFRVKSGQSQGINYGQFQLQKWTGSGLTMDDFRVLLYVVPGSRLNWPLLKVFKRKQLWTISGLKEK